MGIEVEPLIPHQSFVSDDGNLFSHMNQVERAEKYTGVPFALHANTRKSTAASLKLRTNM